MADYPNSYLWNFYGMEIRTAANGIQKITVSNYLSGKTDHQGDKKNVWTKLQNFIRFGKSAETGQAYQQGEWVVDPRLQPHGRVQYHWDSLLGPFNGKGTPERYIRFLHIVDLWLTYGCKGSSRPAAWKSVPTLQDFADKYMGVDCNSLVGGFFETNYAATGWNTSVGWTGKLELKRGAKRQSIGEVKPLDVLVQYTSASKKHVAVIDDIWGVNGSKAKIFMTQSAGSQGGLWSNVCTLEITADGRAKTSNGYTLDFNEGAFGVVGANS